MACFKYEASCKRDDRTRCAPLLTARTQTDNVFGLFVFGFICSGVLCPLVFCRIAPIRLQLMEHSAGTLQLNGPISL